MTRLAAAPAPTGRRADARATVVMKFGGSSLADPERIARVARLLVATADTGAPVVGVVSAMGDTTDRLVALAHEVSCRPPQRELDMLLSVGEQISCALVAMAVHELGHQAISLTGPQAGILTDAAHGNAKIVEINPRRILEAIDSGQIALVTGFQGLGGDEITTLGRGGSDATAVALAAALGAGTCEIYTDVEGVFSADPRLVPDARKLARLCYDEMVELAAAGATVLQLRAVELAQLHRVELHVRSAFSATTGTRISGTDTRLGRPLVTGIGHSLNEALFRVIGSDNAELFAALAEASINLDTIIQIEGEIAFSTGSAERTDVTRVLNGLAPGVTWTEQLDLGRVSVVGDGMKSHSGLAATIFATLRQLGLEASFISTSPIRLSFYVPREAVEPAVRALHAILRPGQPVPGPKIAA